MKIVKNYESFIGNTGSKPANITHNITNESLFTKIGKTLTDFFGSLWAKLKTKFGKDAWWYNCVLYYDTMKDKMKKNGFEFYPAISDSEASDVANDVRNLVPATIAETLDNMAGISEADAEEAYNTLNETVIGMSYPNKAAGIEDITFTELQSLIRKRFNVLSSESDKYSSEKEFREKSKDEKNPLFIWGAPGIAKTSAVKAVAKELGLDLMVWHLSTTAPEDMTGILGIQLDPLTKKPKIDPGTGKPRSQYMLNEMLPTSNGPRGNGVILFLDELNRASKAVLNTCLPLVLEGKIGKFKLPSKVMIIAAGNRAEDVIDGQITPLDPTMMNRFASYNVIYTYDDFNTWATREGKGGGKKIIHPAVLDFLESRDGAKFFHMMDNEKPGSVWPSPRTWTMASQDWVNTAKIKGLDDPLMIPIDHIEDIFAGNVGNEAAQAFCNYIEMNVHFTDKDVDMVFTDPDNAKPIPWRIDIAQKVGKMIASYKSYKPKSATTILDLKDIPVESRLSTTELENFIKYIKKELENRADIAITIIQQFINDHHLWIKSVDHKTITFTGTSNKGSNIITVISDADNDPISDGDTIKSTGRFDTGTTVTKKNNEGSDKNTIIVSSEAKTSSTGNLEISEQVAYKSIWDNFRVHTINVYVKMNKYKDDIEKMEGPKK